MCKFWLINLSGYAETGSCIPKQRWELWPWAERVGGELSLTCQAFYFTYFCLRLSSITNHAVFFRAMINFLKKILILPLSFDLEFFREVEAADWKFHVFQMFLFSKEEENLTVTWKTNSKEENGYVKHFAPSLFSSFTDPSRTSLLILSMR